MFASAILQTSRTTYRGASGSGRGSSAKTSFRSSPASRSTLLPSVLSGRNFKRAQRGLFDGALPQSGNNIPNSLQKTGRTWRPNVQNRTLRSDVLKQPVQTKVTTRAMRTIRKYGGLDAYTANRNGRVLGEWGRALRSKMGEAVVEQKRKSELANKAMLMRKKGEHARASRTAANTTQASTPVTINSNSLPDAP